MKNIATATLVLMFLPMFNLFGQKKQDMKNSIGISVPVIYNRSNGVSYSLGNRKEPVGGAMSYGVGVHLSRLIYKNISVSFGAGYYRQNFNIERPFEFDGDTLTKLLYHTKKYSYHNVFWQLGIGYRYALHQNSTLKAALFYNSLHSYKQYYLPSSFSGFQHKNFQENSKFFNSGWATFLSAGLEQRVYERIGFEAVFVIPVLTNWNSDPVFIASAWGSDAQKIAENRYSYGLILSCKYFF